jgi:hypothetical protein
VTVEHGLFDPCSYRLGRPMGHFSLFVKSIERPDSFLILRSSSFEEEVLGVVIRIHISYNQYSFSPLFTFHLL